jgi:hypothetical protein
MQSTWLNTVQSQIAWERINAQVQPCNIKAPIHIWHDVDADNPAGREFCSKAERRNTLSTAEVKNVRVSESGRSAPISNNRGNINKSALKEWIQHSRGW